MGDVEKIIKDAVAAAEAGGMVGDDNPGDTGSLPDDSGDAGGGGDEGAVDEPGGEGADAEPAAGAADAEKPAAGAGEEPPPADDKKPVPPVEDAFATEHGIKSKDAAGRENRIPFSRVKKINENAVAKAKTTWTDTELKPVQQKVRVYEERLLGIKQTEDTMFGEPAKFVEQLKSLVFPDGSKPYADLLGGAAGAAKPAEESAVPADDTDLGPEPAPDWKDQPTGQTGYTPEGHSKLLAWRDEKTYRRAVRDAETRLTKRYGPIEKAFTSHRERAQAHTELAAATDSLIQDASDWPGFTANFKDIEAVLPSIEVPPNTPNPARAALKLAYEKVVYPKLRTDEDAIRARVAAELKGTPADTGTGTRGKSRSDGGDEPPPGVDRTSWIIKREVAKAEKAARR